MLLRAVLSFSFLLTACGGDDDPVGPDRQAVVDRYATMVHASYAESVTRAEALRDAIDAFVAAPDAATLAAAREAWLAAREPYGQTEVYRFYDGPIDDPDTGPEGRINAWPLDEVFIDYVADDAMAGIINDEAGFPEITPDVIAGQNEVGGEK